MNWTQEAVDDFILEIAPPGEKLLGLDDRITFEGAIKVIQGEIKRKNPTIGLLLKAIRDKFGYEP